MRPTAPRALPSSAALQQSLHEFFGLSRFRPLQQEAVTAALGGQDVLVVMPTGAGKSLCFQLPAALEPGVTVVVSPLIALMRDQVEALNGRGAMSRLGCACINSSQPFEEQKEWMRRLRQGQIRLLYVAPERFRSPFFLKTLQSISVARFVVDEAHCITEWGRDFRPDYLSLGAVVQSLGRPPIMAVTATATSDVQQSIVQNLGMRDPAILVGGFNRPNLYFGAQACDSEKDRIEILKREMPGWLRGGGSGLVYVSTQKQSEELATILAGVLKPLRKTAGAYHAGMSSINRTRLQSQWLAGDVPVLVATSAFGMGIDKADVRFVIHVGYPDSLESYYQGAGRAGRDGKMARCVILHHSSDRETREWLMERDTVTGECLKTLHGELCANLRDDTIFFSKTLWQQKLNWSETRARIALGEMERAGVVERVQQSKDGVTLRVLQRTIPRALWAGMVDGLQRQRQERKRRLEEMVGYCQTPKCRRRTILDYFGDPESISSPERCCDNCDPSGHISMSAGSPTSTASRVREPARSTAGNPVPKPFPKSPPPSPTVTAMAEPNLLEALREWRRGEAANETIPTYYILGDTVLGEIARHKPRSGAALGAIRGMDEDRLLRFGPAILAIVREHAAGKRGK